MLGTLFEYQRRILNGATFRTRAEPLQLRSSSGCKRYILNALLMLRTFECKRYTLKVTCRLNVRGVSPQSRPRCMIDQPTCIAVKEPIVNVHLTFTDHPTLKTLGHISRSHGRALLLESLHIQHSGTDHQSVGRLSSSLPLQSAPYASTSPRTLRTPYRALNALSSTQMRASSALDPARLLAQSPSPPHQAC